MALTIEQASNLLNEHKNGLLVNFMPLSQRRALMTMLIGEEREAAVELVERAVEMVKNTPLTYQSAEETNEKVVGLHYFNGSIDVWIVERDVGDTLDGNGCGVQHQAYGRASFSGGWEGGEWGYISLAEHMQHDLEMDLYWEPKTVGQVRAELCA